MRGCDAGVRLEVSGVTHATLPLSAQQRACFLLMGQRGRSDERHGYCAKVCACSVRMLQHAWQPNMCLRGQVRVHLAQLSVGVCECYAWLSKTDLDHNTQECVWYRGHHLLMDAGLAVIGSYCKLQCV